MKILGFFVGPKNSPAMQAGSFDCADCQCDHDNCDSGCDYDQCDRD